MKIFRSLICIAVALFFTVSVSLAEESRGSSRNESVATIQKVDINSADAEVLSLLLIGIGEKKAEAIVAYREENGPFKTQNELLNVKGIGQSILSKNSDRILLSSK